MSGATCQEWIRARDAHHEQTQRNLGEPGPNHWGSPARHYSEVSVVLSSLIATLRLCIHVAY